MNSQNKDGNSPLHFATKIVLKAVSTLLLRNSATVDIWNKKGQTPTNSGFLTGLSSSVTKLFLEALTTEKATPKVLPEYALDVKTLGFCS
jgi:ankyrin repeat protein